MVQTADLGVLVTGNSTEGSRPSMLELGTHAANAEVVCTLDTCITVQEVVERQIAACDSEDAFFVADLGAVIRQHDQWKRLLPRVEPFYAVKCNDDSYILNTLASRGLGFDCASKAEIATVLLMGVAPSRVIYANPCKPSSHIRFAKECGVEMMTFDNANELTKIKQIYPEAKLVLRILTDDSRSKCRFGVKFGAHPGNTLPLLQAAKEMGLDVIGVSFHVGSGCFDAQAFGDAVHVARRVFDEGAMVGYDFNFLDIGGGFPGIDAPGVISFKEIADILRPAIDELFDVNVRVIAEPGRYFSAAAFSLAVNVTSCRVVHHPEGDSQKRSFMYYVNDGVYGSFNCLLFDHAVVYPRVVTKNGSFVSSQREHQLYECSVWGPTCDSMDCIMKQTVLPELDIGDWLCFDNMGSYTMAAASTFNGFPKSRIIYINTEPICYDH